MDVDQNAQTTEVQAALETSLNWLRQQLEDDEIDGQTNFLEAGGHSILGNQLRRLLRDEYALDVDLQQLFQESLSTAMHLAKTWTPPRDQGLQSAIKSSEVS